MLGSIKDYIFIWQLPFIALFIAGWLLGGGYLLRYSVHKHLQKRRFGLQQAIGTVFLAGIVGVVCAAIGFSLISTIGGKLEMSLRMPALAVAGLLALILAYLVLYAVLNIPAGTALKVVAAPLGGVVVLGLVIAVPTGAIAYGLRQESLERYRCLRNVVTIGGGLASFQAQTGKPAGSLDTLVEKNILDANTLICPSTDGQKESYFYIPSSIIPQRIETRQIVICDLKGNHGKGRNVLFANGRYGWHDEDDFQELLKDEKNKAFAKALADLETQ